MKLRAGDFDIAARLDREGGHDGAVGLDGRSDPARGPRRAAVSPPAAVEVIPSAPEGQIRTGRLAGLSLNAAIWVISWPILAQAFLDALIGTVDTTVAAHLGVAQTDAIGTATYMMWLVGVIVMSVAIGATALISRAIGAGYRGRANEVLGQSIALSVMVGVVAAAILALAAPWLGAPIGLDAESARHMRNYLWPLAAAVPPMIITFVGFACLRGAGESRSPLWIMLIENGINIPLTVLLSGVHLKIALLGRTLEMQAPASLDYGIVGIGVATLIARCVGAAIVVWMLCRGAGPLRLHLHRLWPRWEPMKSLLRVGVPNLWESLGMWVGNFVIILMIGHMLVASADGGLIGAHQIAIRLEAFAFLPGFAMGTAAATLMGQYLGAGNPTMARRAAIRCCVVAAVIMGAFGYLFIVHPHDLVAIMSQQELHLEVVPPILRLAGYVQIPFALLLVLRSGLRGAGDTKVAMYLTWIGIYGVRVPGCFLAAWLYPEHGLYPLWLVMVIELTVRAALFLGRFLHGGWMRIEV